MGVQGGLFSMATLEISSCVVSVTQNMYVKDQCRGSMRADSNASWMTRRIVVYVSGVVHQDAARLDKDDLDLRAVSRLCLFYLMV